MNITKCRVNLSDEHKCIYLCELTKFKNFWEK